MTTNITLFLNGEPREMAAGSTVTDLVATIVADPRGVAIERNRDIVAKSQWDATILADGDRLEVVQFVGGG
jgi:thiamine biosynthesis protein ThiS